MTGKFLIPSNVPIRKLDDHWILVNFLKDFDQNSGGQPFRWLWNSLLKILVWKVRKLDDHRILMKCFKNFNPNSGGQPQYLTTQLQDLIQLLVIKLRLRVKQEFWSEFQFLKNYAVICFCKWEKLTQNQMTVEILWTFSMILIRILMRSFRGKFIRWLCNSSRLLIRILVWKGNCLFFDQNSSQKQICNFNVSWFYVILIEF